MSQRRGFTLVELLVVITIIAILIAMLLPAVQSAREAARQTQCSNNMKQLGLACLNYESQYGAFPPSSYHPVGTTRPGMLRTHACNWVISILPFLEQQAVYESFNLSMPINDSCNRTARGTDLSVMKCPSDLGHRVKFASVDVTEGDNWARGNYAANASLGFHFDLASSAFGGTYSAAGTTSALAYSRYHRGIMGSNLSMGVSEIYDGTSNTLLLGEIRVGLIKEDRRGVWALDGAGVSALWAHGWQESDGPNPCSGNVDNLLDCTTVTNNAGGLTAIRSACMGCYDGEGSDRAAVKSRHPGGVMVTMADGGTRFISNYIEKGLGQWADSPGMTTQFLCWERLCASQDGQVVDAKKF